VESAKRGKSKILYRAAHETGEESSACVSAQKQKSQDLFRAPKTGKVKILCRGVKQFCVESRAETGEEIKESCVGHL
jgi:hypothetical protein